MKWTWVASAGLLLHSASSLAVMIAPAGAGEVLIYPYYSTRDGTQSLLSVVNHDRTGKAVKVHVREGRNGRSVASFNLYLAEFDVWTAALFTAADGTPALLTQDRSCVDFPGADVALPVLPNGQRYLPFSNADYSGTRADGDDPSLARAAEGYIEVIEMGSLVDNSDSDLSATQVNGVPLSCRTLEAAWEPGGYWTANQATDLGPPSGQLSGALTLIKVAEGVAYSVDATALTHFSIVAQHSAPADTRPDLSSAVTDPARQAVESLALIEGRYVRSRWPQERAIDAVSAVLTQDSAQIEYSIEAQIGATTDWFISLPTRRHYTDPALVETAVAPFTRRFAATQSCEVIRASVYNREAARSVGRVDLPGFEPRDTCLCGAVQILPIGRRLPAAPADSRCSDMPLSTTFSGSIFQQGFVSLNFAEYPEGGPRPGMRASLNEEIYAGLPLLGFSTLRYRNDAARPGEIGLYGAARNQTGTARCQTAASSGCATP